MTSTVPAPVTRTAEGSALQAVLLDMDGTLVDTEGSGGTSRSKSSPASATPSTTHGAMSWSAAP